MEKPTGQQQRRKAKVINDWLAEAPLVQPAKGQLLPERIEPPFIGGESYTGKNEGSLDVFMKNSTAHRHGRLQHNHLITRLDMSDYDTAFRFGGCFYHLGLGRAESSGRMRVACTHYVEELSAYVSVKDELGVSYVDVEDFVHFFVQVYRWQDDEPLILGEKEDNFYHAEWTESGDDPRPVKRDRSNYTDRVELKTGRVSRGTELSVRVGIWGGITGVFNDYSIACRADVKTRVESILIDFE